MSSDATEAEERGASTSVVQGATLWVLVSGALLYGIVKTADTASALFTGG